MTDANMFYPLPALERHLQRITQLPLTILLAPMGFGKTTAIRAYLEESGFSCAQLRLTERQTDPRMIWECYIHSLKRELPALAAIFERAAAPRDCASRAQLVNAIEDSIASTTVLVFDDYQNVAASAIHTFIEVLARQNIPLLHIVLLSRSRPPLACMKELQLKGLCQILAKHLFCFQETDIAAYFQINGASITAKEAASLHTYSEGWVAVLRFVFLALLSGGKMDVTVDLNDLLHQVLCESCSQSEITLLRQLSPYPEFSAVQAENLAQCTQIRHLLRRLSADCALLVYDRQRALFTWNELLRAYLQAWPVLSPSNVQENGENVPSPGDVAVLPLEQPGVKAPTVQLSRREKQVLTLLCRGMRRAAIAQALYISLSSVKKNIESIYTKLQVNNVAAAINAARENGLIPLHLTQTPDPHIHADLLLQQ